MGKTKGSLALSDPIQMTFDTYGERIMLIPLSDLYPPDFHPFEVKNDSAMERLSKSVKRYGIREPGLARPREEGGYELLAGNRRKRACEISGVAALPVIIREMDDDAAVIAMVDSNLEQRDSLLPSEKAWACRGDIQRQNHPAQLPDGNHPGQQAGIYH